MNSLEDLLAQLYRTADEASRILRRAGLNPADVDLTGRAKVFWFRILDEAWRRGRIGEVVACAAAEYPQMREGLEQAVDPFLERLKQGGEPIEITVWQRILRRLAIPAATACLLGTAALFFLPRPDPTSQLWEKIGKLEQSSVGVTNQLTAITVEGRSALQAKTQEIDRLKDETRNLEASIAELRGRLGQGGLTADQQARIERAEAAVKNNEALILYSNGRLDQALAAMDAAVAAYRKLGADRRDEGFQNLLGRSLIRQSAMQTEKGQPEQARASLDEAKKTLPATPDNRQIVAAATKKAGGGLADGSPTPPKPPDLVVVPKPAASSEPAAGPEPPPVPVRPSGPSTAPSRSASVPPISFEPSTISGILVEPLQGPEGIAELWRSNPGETSGPRLEQVGKITVVDPGSYDLWCRTTGSADLKLVSRLEVRDGHLTRVNPGALVGHVLVEPWDRGSLPGVSAISVINQGIWGKETYFSISQGSKKLGIPFPIMPGDYDLLCEPAKGERFLVERGVKVEPGRETRVSLADKIGAFVVPKEKLAGIDFEAILVLRAGTRQIEQRTDAAGQPMLVGAGEPFEIVLRQPSGPYTLKKAAKAKAGELTTVP
jgi:tetratricopeptide (TPR) repeat protein